MIILRPLAADDSFTELTALLHAAYAPLAARGLRYLASHQDAATTEKRAKGGTCFVAVDTENQMLAGTLTLYGPTPNSPCALYREPDVWHFAQFAVCPTVQGQGVGRRLLETVETAAKEAGASRIACDTSESAHDLIALYERKGYQPSGRVVWQNVTNYESVVLVKTLNGANENGR